MQLLRTKWLCNFFVTVWVLWEGWFTSDSCLLQGSHWWWCKELSCEVFFELDLLAGDHKILLCLFQGGIFWFAIFLSWLVGRIYSLLCFYARAIIHFLSAWKLSSAHLWLLSSSGLQFQIQEALEIIVKIVNCWSAVKRHRTLGRDASCSADGRKQLNKQCQRFFTCCYVSHIHTWGQGGLPGAALPGCVSSHGQGLRVITCRTW